MAIANGLRQSVWSLTAIVALFLLVSSWMVCAESSADVPQLFQESSQSESKQAQSSPIKTIMSDSGELTILSKRRSGFLPSRGKKDFSDFDDAAMDQYRDSARVAFLTEAAKRASGFLPMRGRKSDGDFADNVLNEEMMEKRRVSSFMPMRGRKWSPIQSGQAESAGVPSTANVWYHRYYHPVPLGAVVAGPAPMLNVPVKLADNSYMNDEPLIDSANLEKRKGMGFFGARGKRSAHNA